MEHFDPRKEYIAKASIPDDDLANWMQTLREGNFTDEEIDGILVHLNAEYAKVKKPEIIQKRMKEVEERVKQMYHGHTFSEEEKELLKKQIEREFDEKNK